MRLILYVDGASRGNPGEAAIGASLQRPSGKEVDCVSEAIGITTNNEAEYRALVAGLERALKRKCTEIQVRADSELIVRQMLGEYKVKHENLKRFWREAQALKDRFKRFEIKHVPREENRRADELANMALDQ
ncbi:MAG: ribonuclease HI family protein [Pseudomonadota bacterium]